MPPMFTTLVRAAHRHRANRPGMGQFRNTMRHQCNAEHVHFLQHLLMKAHEIHGQHPHHEAALGAPRPTVAGVQQSRGTPKGAHLPT